MRPRAGGACRPGTTRARRPFYGKLPVRWQTFGVGPVGKRLGDNVHNLHSGALLLDMPTKRPQRVKDSIGLLAAFRDGCSDNWRESTLNSIAAIPRLGESIVAAIE